MELKVSNKTGNFVSKPHIKKGYYPAKLVDIKEFKKDDKWVEDKYGGRKLILEFGVWAADADGKPAKPMTVTKKEEGQATQTADVILSQFVTFMYKKSDEERTAVTPNSHITKTFKALGWKFNADEMLKPKEFLGNWLEVNVDDYKKTVDGDEIIMSVIKDVSEYDGPAVDLQTDKKAEASAEAAKPKSTSTQVNSKDVKTDKAAKVLDVQNRMESIKKLHESGTVSKEGFAQAMEQLEKELVEAQK